MVLPAESMAVSSRSTTLQRACRSHTPAGRRATLRDWFRPPVTSARGGLRFCGNASHRRTAPYTVQVLPQKPTGKSTLSGIPFGVKISSERGALVTEYGSTWQRCSLRNSNRSMTPFPCRESSGLILLPRIRCCLRNRCRCSVSV